ncbi:MAG: acyltransferase [Microbacteriaceae bacterium]|nr:acyltransferase [Microbacteriaceae bacterium]
MKETNNIPYFEAAVSKAQRLNSLTGLRWWAAFLVFLYHLDVFAPLPAFISRFTKYGFHGVAFFFILSGFVLTWTFNNKTPISTQYLRRFAKIFPLHVVTLLIAIPVFYSFSTLDETQTWVKPFQLGILLLSLLLLQAWSRDPVVLFSGNPAAWTLSVEVFFYALLPWIGKLLKFLNKRKTLVFLGLTLFAIVFYRFLQFATNTDFGQNSLPWPILRIGEFLLGAFAAWAMRQGWLPKIPVTVSLIAVLTVFLLLGLQMQISDISPQIGSLINFFNSELVIFCFLLIIISLARADILELKTIFRTTLQVKLGEWSFAFYLIHATILYTLLNIFGHQEAKWSNAFIAIPILIFTVFVAWALHRVIEKPIEKKLRKWKDTKDSLRLKEAELK